MSRSSEIARRIRAEFFPGLGPPWRFSAREVERRLGTPHETTLEALRPMVSSGELDYDPERHYHRPWVLVHPRFRPALEVHTRLRRTAARRFVDQMVLLDAWAREGLVDQAVERWQRIREALQHREDLTLEEVVQLQNESRRAEEELELLRSADWTFGGVLPDGPSSEDVHQELVRDLVRWRRESGGEESPEELEDLAHGALARGMAAARAILETGC